MFRRVNHLENTDVVLHTEINERNKAVYSLRATETSLPRDGPLNCRSMPPGKVALHTGIVFPQHESYDAPPTAFFPFLFFYHLSHDLRASIP